jgi:N utilization substance protein B
MAAQDRGMARARRGARESLVKALYQWQIAGSSRDELLEQFTAAGEHGRIDGAYFREILDAVMADMGDLDAIIAARADRGAEQQDAVSRAVLLIALTELRRRPDVPTKVIINEAVELAKRYGPADGYRFVNAVLDKVAAGMPGRQLK